MPVLHYTFAAILVLFAAVQYNDPDWYVWTPIYLVAALWSYLAASAPERLRSWPPALYGAPICLVLFLIGFGWLAPTINWGWIHVEEAREALGYLICALTTSLALWDGRRRSRP